MPRPVVTPEVSANIILGDEAVAMGAVHAGISAAYAYPGTPATEILEFVMQLSKGSGRPIASWCANEKTAYEGALGVSMAGRRVLVTMKHVGLNVAADPFINSALIHVAGGLVLVVADDPGMHSSQNEQDSRFYADFAAVPCLEPATPQEAYDMVREAFDVSERFQIPVVVRLVTRLAHQRAEVVTGQQRAENPLRVSRTRADWVLLPAFSRAQRKRRLNEQALIQTWSESSSHNHLTLNPSFRDLGVITTGLAQSYFLETAGELGLTPSHLHVGAYPIPVDQVRRLFEHVHEVLVIEEGYPFVEHILRGLIHPAKPIRGKETSDIPPDGELSVDIVRKALGLPIDSGTTIEHLPLPARPPRLCDGCPHIDAYKALNDALAGFPSKVVTSDIGCYTLGILPPYEVGDSCVCMGASIGMARGAAEAGVYPVVAVIGDSTFLHSGMTALIDAVSKNVDMTLLILDNDVTAMTGGQPTILPSQKLRDVVLGLGVSPEHLHAIESHPRKVEEVKQILRKEIEHHGLSVVIVHRECLEAIKSRKKP